MYIYTVFGYVIAWLLPHEGQSTAAEDFQIGNICSSQ